jgi:thiol:disulfide interchange protein DsbC
MKLISRLIFVVGLSGLLSISWAGELEQARENIMARFDGVKAENIQPSPVKGLYEVILPPQVFYASADGLYVVDGDVIELSSRRNITREQRGRAAVAAIDAMGEESMITFAPEKVKHTITVFTDIDCGYCRKLHQSMDEYNQLGIKVRYMAFPRAGIGSSSYNKAVSAWCADDPKQALTRAKNNQPIETKTCDNPVAAQYQLGQMMGISGTPAIVMESGRIIPGYVPPKRLVTLLDGKMPGNARFESQR